MRRWTNLQHQHDPHDVIRRTGDEVLIKYADKTTEWYPADEYLALTHEVRDERPIYFTARETYALNLCLNAAGNADAWSGEQDDLRLQSAISTAAAKIRKADE